MEERSEIKRTKKINFTWNVWICIISSMRTNKKDWIRRKVEVFILKLAFFSQTKILWYYHRIGYCIHFPKRCSFIKCKYLHMLWIDYKICMERLNTYHRMEDLFPIHVLNRTSWRLDRIIHIPSRIRNALLICPIDRTHLFLLLHSTARTVDHKLQWKETKNKRKNALCSKITNEDQFIWRQ